MTCAISRPQSYLFQATVKGPSELFVARPTGAGIDQRAQCQEAGGGALIWRLNAVAVPTGIVALVREKMLRRVELSQPLRRENNMWVWCEVETFNA